MTWYFNVGSGTGDTASHWMTCYRCFLPDLAGFAGSNCTAPLCLMRSVSPGDESSKVRDDSRHECRSLEKVNESRDPSPPWFIVSLCKRRFSHRRKRCRPDLLPSAESPRQLLCTPKDKVVVQ